MKQTIIIKDATPESSRGRIGVFRCLLSLFLAMGADGLQWLLPPLWFIWDGGMVLALLLIWGWRWEILVAVVPEAIPGLDLFPTWTLFAGYLIALKRKR